MTRPKSLSSAKGQPRRSSEGGAYIPVTRQLNITNLLVILEGVRLVAHVSKVVFRSSGPLVRRRKVVLWQLEQKSKEFEEWCEDVGVYLALAELGEKREGARGHERQLRRGRPPSPNLSSQGLNLLPVRQDEVVAWELISKVGSDLGEVQAERVGSVS